MLNEDSGGNKLLGERTKMVESLVSWRGGQGLFRSCRDRDLEQSLRPEIYWKQKSVWCCITV